MKLLGIDYGTKRVGLASTDESGEFALPRAVWPNTEDLVRRLVEFAHTEEAEVVVLGESKNLDGTHNPIHAEVMKLKNELESNGLRVVLWPEVYSTVEARLLQDSNSLTDASAAAIVLKSYIDSLV